MSSNGFYMPSTLHLGEGAAAQVGPEVARRNATKALIVTDKHVLDAGCAQVVMDSLAAAGCSVEIYAGVDKEPTLQHIDEGLRAIYVKGCDVIVGVGGGSALDVAKALGVLAGNGKHIGDYMGQDKIPKKGLPVFAVPTTAGTGSEVTKFTIITDTENDVKMLIGSPYLVPDAAFVDPGLTLSMPKSLTAATGLDALTHAIEAYVSRKAQPMTDSLALSAVGLIAENLPKAWHQPSDFAAREKTMIGALQAGIAFSNASVALVHGMSRPVGALFHVAHGVSNAALLGVVMEYSLNGNMQRYADIALAMGVEPAAGKDAETLARAGAKRVVELIKELEVPSLTQLGVSREKLEPVVEKMAEDAIASGSPANNPKVASKEEIMELYFKAL